MSSAEKKPITNELLENFCAITGCTQERAKFYLEAANGSLDLAIESFYENGGNEGDTEMTESAATGPPGFRMEEEDDDDDEDDEDYSPSKHSNPFARLAGSSKTNNPKEDKKPKRSSAATASKKIFTLSEMNNENSDEEGEEKGQAFYAGGSETSGQQILGPPRRNPEKIIKDLFEKAKEHGAQEVDPNEDNSNSKRTPVVYGTGYRLGTGKEPTEVIPGPPRPKQKKVSVLKLWKNGFTVNDGPLRSFDDPKNKEFLSSIQRGELPQELIRDADGGEVHLDMQDHRDEEFVPPKNKYVLYNDGYKLGSPTPTVVSNATPNEKVNNETKAKANLKLNESASSTQVQVRLSDGSRLVIKLNNSHTVRDIRSYINTARPEYNQRVYSLLTSFPNKELTDDSETLEQGKLQNAVIIQKLQA